MKQKVKLITIMLLALIAISLASALYQLNGSDINKEYAPGENISGWINISFSDEPASQKLLTNFGNEINLLNLLKANNAQFSCIPAKCGDNYITDQGGDNKKISLNAGESKILAFKITGNINSIQGLAFNISSTADKSCINPLKIDLLDDGSIDWFYKTGLDDFTCFRNSGCFDSQAEISEFNIVNKPYCEKIKINEAPRIRIGAWVKKDGAWKAGLLKMQIASIDGNVKSQCDLPEPSISGGEISCVANFSVDKEQDYYVCIKATNQTSYKLRGENIQPCGYFDIFTGNYTYDYHIFAEGGRFSEIKSVNINNIFSSSVEDYIAKNYAKKCENGCAIPIKFLSGVSQELEINNIKIDYTSSSGSITSNEIYDVEKTPAKISSGFIKVDLEKAGFLAPNNYGNNSIIISIGNETLLENKINIIEKPIINNLFPNSAQAAVSTYFYADVYSPGNKSIVKYKWNFGDGTNEEAINKVQHTYSNIGSYQLILEVQDSSGLKAIKTFIIDVGSPKESINSSLNNKKLWLNNLTTILSSLDTWEANQIKEAINISGLDARLKAVERDYLSYNSTVKEIEIMTKLNNIKIPRAIDKRNSGSFPLIELFKNIASENLKQLGAGSYKAGDYSDIIKAWFLENMQGTISSETIFFDYETNKEPIMTFFKLNTQEKKDVGEIFLVVNKDVKFKNQEAKNLNGAKGLALENGNKEIEFSIPGFILLSDLEVYLAPKFSALKTAAISPCNFNNLCEKNKEENSGNCREDCKPYGWMIFWIIIILILGLAGYIFLQEWYKKRYEERLFNNSNELRSLISYFKQGLQTGKQEKEIIRELHKTGWNLEQIGYALKKSKGERIMWEIPIPSFLRFWDRGGQKPIVLPERKQQQTNNSQENPQGFRSGFKPLGK